METQNILKYLDCELYQVETDENGKKTVHVDGYVYEGEGLQLVQFTGCFINVEDLIISQDIMDTADQYQGDISEEEARKYYSKCYPLSLIRVRENTPDGLYVNYPRLYN